MTRTNGIHPASSMYDRLALLDPGQAGRQANQLNGRAFRLQRRFKPRLGLRNHSLETRVAT
jgi:hypothetical protein